MAFKMKIDGSEHVVEIVARRPHLRVRIDGRDHEITETGTSASGQQSLKIDGTAVAFSRAHLGERQILRLDGMTFEALVVDPRSEALASGSGQDRIRAPMPGSVVSVQKQAGATVARGETILTIESMKLQTGLTAPRAGVIAEIFKAEGETFEKDDVLIRLEETAGEG